MVENAVSYAVVGSLVLLAIVFAAHIILKKRSGRGIYLLDMMFKTDFILYDRCVPYNATAAVGLIFLAPPLVLLLFFIMKNANSEMVGNFLDPIVLLGFGIPLGIGLPTLLLTYRTISKQKKGM